MAESGLIVRRGVRHEVVLPARVRVAPAHAAEIRFTKGVTDPNGWFEVSVVDFAAGGVGFVSTVFIPRGACLEIEIMATETPDEKPILKAGTRVMRTQMTDRRPAYLIGTAFIEIDDATETQVLALMDRLNGEPG